MTNYQSLIQGMLCNCLRQSTYLSSSYFDWSGGFQSQAVSYLIGIISIIIDGWTVRFSRGSLLPLSVPKAFQVGKCNCKELCFAYFSIFTLSHGMIWRYQRKAMLPYTQQLYYQLHFDNTDVDPLLLTVILPGTCSTRCWNHYSEILAHTEMVASHSCCRFLSCASIHIPKVICDCRDRLSTMNCLRNHFEMI